MANHARVHDWAQKALNEFNGQYRTNEILEKAWGWTASARNMGNADHDLAVADHYMFCRMLAAKSGLFGAQLVGILALGYDGAYKALDTLVQRLGGGEVVFRTGNVPPSRFDKDTLRWDMQGLQDGCADVVLSWGKPTLGAPKRPDMTYLTLWS